MTALAFCWAQRLLLGWRWRFVSGARLPWRFLLVAFGKRLEGSESGRRTLCKNACSLFKCTWFCDHYEHRRINFNEAKKLTLPQARFLPVTTGHTWRIGMLPPLSRIIAIGLSNRQNHLVLDRAKNSGFCWFVKKIEIMSYPATNPSIIAVANDFS